MNTKRTSDEQSVRSSLSAGKARKIGGIARRKMARESVRNLLEVKKNFSMREGSLGNSSQSPLPKKEEKKVPAPVPPPKKVVPQPKKPQSPLGKRPPPVVKEMSKSPTKPPNAQNAFDRLPIRKRKPEMKDAWTQTTPRPHDEARRQRKLLQA